MSSMNLWSVALGVIITGVLSHFIVPRIVTCIDDKVREQLTKDGKTEEVGLQLVDGDILGNLECALYFAIALTGVTTMTYYATDDKFHLS